MPPIALITVHHHPSGVSEIAATDLEDLRAFDRYQATSGPGLQLHLHPGRAIAGGTLPSLPS